MLDTRMPPISPRTRRFETARPGTSARPARKTPPAQSHAPAREHAREQTRPPSDGATLRRALPSARSSRLSRAEMRLMGLATVCLGVVCALFLLYLAAYAQVTQLGIAQASARAELRRSQLRFQLLEAERNSLQSPQRILAAAAAQGMMPRGRTPVSYIKNTPGGERGGSGGTTQHSRAENNRAENSRAAASFGD